MPENAPAVVTESAAFQPHFTCAQLAKQWGLSINTIARIFRSEPGVLLLGNPRSKKRTRISMRIPATVAERVHAKLSSPN
jgi:hypothetical protein